LIAGEPSPLAEAQRTNRWQRKSSANFAPRKSAPACDFSSDNINDKIQRAEQMKVHIMFVIGKRDPAAAGPSASASTAKGNLGAKPRGEAIPEILQSIKERRA
jgi:threonyl-tRNA synthetase